MLKMFPGCLFALVLLTAVAIRLVMAIAIGLSHDEVISILTAQGNEERYEEAARNGLAKQWVPAIRWQAFYNEPTDRSLSEIAEDLAKYDIHPPLYFWILRPWIGTFGADAARFLNVPILLISAALLFVFAQRYVSMAGAFLAVAIWLLSPQSIRTSATARQYELLGLFALLTAWQAGRLLDGKTEWKNLSGFAAIALGAMLTQYLAAAFILTAVAVVLVQRREIWPHFGAALAGAAVLFFFLHPGFYRHVGRYETAAGFNERLIEAASTLLGFWGWRNTWTTPAIAWGALITATVLVSAGVWSLRSSRLRLPLALAIAPAGIALIFYLAALTPSHGFAGRHLAFFWPFLALLHAVAIDGFGRRALVPALALTALVTAPGELWLAHRKQGDDDIARIVAAAPQIVLNNAAMGILPRYLREARSDAMVYVSENIPADEMWLSNLRPGSVVILNAQYLPSAGATRFENVVAHQLTRVLKKYTTTIYRRE